jgi:hypothetical protein
MDWTAMGLWVDGVKLTTHLRMCGTIVLRLRIKVYGCMELYLHMPHGMHRDTEEEEEKKKKKKRRRKRRRRRRGGGGKGGEEEGRGEGDYFKTHLT